MRLEKLQTTSPAAPPLSGTGEPHGHFAAMLSAAGQAGDHFAAPLSATALPSEPNRPTGGLMIPLSSARPPVAISSTAQPADGSAQADAAAAEDKLREVCRQFEAFFTAQLMQTMRESDSVEGVIKTSRAEKVFRSQHDAHLARHLARRGALGLGDLLYRQLSDQIGHSASKPDTEGK